MFFYKVENVIDMITSLLRMQVCDLNQMAQCMAQYLPSINIRASKV